MNYEYYGLTIFFIALGTYAIRCSFVLFHDKIYLPIVFKRGLKYLAVAILPALVAPAIVFHQGSVGFLEGKERIIAGIIALMVSVLSKNMIATLVAGYCTLLILKL